MPPRVVCLTNAYDQQYHDLRREEVSRCLSSPKRRDLFKSIEIATDREVLVLSSPPKALSGTRIQWLPPVSTRFSTHPQRFCGLLDIPKLRIPFAWVAYSRQALRYIRSGDIVVLDNYELLYVIASLAVHSRRRVTFILDYEDGKHAIDRSWVKTMSGAAEYIGRELIDGAILAHPSLRTRLPNGVPHEIVPGFVRSERTGSARSANGPVRMLYSGSLDRARGVDLLLEALELLPNDCDWRLDITGTGPLENSVRDLASREHFRHRLRYHGSLPPEPYEKLLDATHVGLNCQRLSDPISDVSFPSKIFTYLSAGMQVLSSRASEVGMICGEACRYYEGESASALAGAIQTLSATPTPGQQHALEALQTNYSIEGTAERLRLLFERIELKR